MANWYLGSTKHTAIAQWAANTVYGAGSIVRQLAAPAVNSERCFRTAAGGTSHATTEPIWVLTKGAAQPADGTITDWVEVTGNETYGWLAAHARLFSAFAWMAAGDTVWVSNNHAETQTTYTPLIAPGTAAAPCNILCVVDNATPPTVLATTATVTVSGNTLNMGTGFCYAYGITFMCHIGYAINLYPTTPYMWIFDSCVLKISNGINEFGGGYNSDDQLLVLKNTNIYAQGTASTIKFTAIRFFWKGGSLINAAPTTLFRPQPTYPCQIYIRGVDLSIMGSGTNLVNIAALAPNKISFQNCKLGAAVAAVTGTSPGQGGTEVILDNCDSGDTNYRNEWYRYQGSIVTETTIKRTGGASDGTTAFCRKMVALATGALFVSPLESPAVLKWNETVGSAITATIEIMHDSVTNLQDDEVWVEIEYLGTSGFPLSLFASDRMADIMATPADQAAGTGVGNWTTTGLTNPNSQKLSVTFTPQEKGLLSAKVMVGKANYTLYYDPIITVT